MGGKGGGGAQMTTSGGGFDNLVRPQPTPTPTPPPPVYPTPTPIVPPAGGGDTNMPLPDPVPITDPNTGTIGDALGKYVDPRYWLDTAGQASLRSGRSLIVPGSAPGLGRVFNIPRGGGPV